MYTPDRRTVNTNLGAFNTPAITNFGDSSNFNFVNKKEEQAKFDADTNDLLRKEEKNIEDMASQVRAQDKERIIKQQVEVRDQLRELYKKYHAAGSDIRRNKSSIYDKAEFVNERNKILDGYKKSVLDSNTQWELYDKIGEVAKQQENLNGDLLTSDLQRALAGEGKKLEFIFDDLVKGKYFNGSNYVFSKLGTQKDWQDYSVMDKGGNVWNGKINPQAFTLQNNKPVVKEEFVDGLLDNQQFVNHVESMIDPNKVYAGGKTYLQLKKEGQIDGVGGVKEIIRNTAKEMVQKAGDQMFAASDFGSRKPSSSSDNRPSALQERLKNEDDFYGNMLERAKSKDPNILAGSTDKWYSPTVEYGENKIIFKGIKLLPDPTNNGLIKDTVTTVKEFPYTKQGMADMKALAEGKSTDYFEKKSDNTSKSQKKKIKASDIPAKAKAAGYTADEYIELLKKNGVEIEK